jgi:hypothetical protein
MNQTREFPNWFSASNAETRGQSERQNPYESPQVCEEAQASPTNEFPVRKQRMYFVVACWFLLALSYIFLIFWRPSFPILIDWCLGTTVVTIVAIGVAWNAVPSRQWGAYFQTAMSFVSTQVLIWLLAIL